MLDDTQSITNGGASQRVVEFAAICDQGEKLYLDVQDLDSDDDM